jgi:hypothetical protein
MHAPEGAGTMREIHLDELLFDVQQNVSRDLSWRETMTDAAGAQQLFANSRKVLRERCDPSYNGAKPNQKPRQITELRRRTSSDESCNGSGEFPRR